MNSTNVNAPRRRRKTLASVAEEHVCEIASATFAWLDGMAPQFAGCGCELEAGWSPSEGFVDAGRGISRRLARVFIPLVAAAMIILVAMFAPKIADAMQVNVSIPDTTSGEEAPHFALVTPEVRSDFLAGRTSKDFRIDVLREAYFRRNVPYGSIIYREAVENDLPPELVAAVVKAESSFRPSLVSPKNAHGLMQLIPSTAEQMGAEDIMSPHENIRAGTRYLRYLHDRFDGDRSLALAAYNAGEGNVDRYGGVPPFGETRGYLTKVNRYQKQYQLRVASSANRWKRVRFELAK